MNIFRILLVCFLCFSKCFARYSLTHQQHQHSHPRPHARPIANYVQSKLHSVLSWLNSKHDSTAFDYIYNVNKGLGLNLYEGDIRGHRNTRVAVKNNQRLWTTRIIPYTFDPSFDTNERRSILAGIDEFHNKTCLRFIPRTNEKDYINFNQIEGCSSEVGKTGGKQQISLMSSCLIQGTIIHEIMHVLGFFHEQGRPDRDSWIQVVYSNVQTGKEYNFYKESANEVTTLGLQYDYGSVMHYSKYAFTKNGGPTLLPIFQTNAQLGQRSHMSNLDAQKINTLYQCGKDMSALPTVQQKVPTKMAIQPTGATNAPVPATASVTSSAQKVTAPPTMFIPNVPTINQPGWSVWSQWSSCDLACNRRRYRFCLKSDTHSCYGAKTQTELCDSSCKAAWSLGCWKENSNNLAIPSGFGLSKLPQTRDEALSAIRQCGNFASQNGYTVFAIFKESICLTGSRAATMYMKYGPSNECKSNGLGGLSSSSVYSLNRNRDGNWNNWGSWGVCSRTCGGGQRYRYRRCNNPIPFGDGAPCQGSDREYSSCNSNACAVDAKCGTKFHTGIEGTSGMISLRNYSNFMECEYKILTGNTNSTISLAFTRLDVEYSSNCLYDAIMVFDGPDDRSNLIGSYCGNSAPSSIQSSLNKLFIKFESDATNIGGGFDLLYTINNKRRKSCVRPMVTPHSRITGNSNFVGDQVVYQCENNYNLIGSSSITCIDQPGLAVWSDSFPYCIRNFKRSARHSRSKLCTFEENMCGFTQDSSDNFDWKIYEANSGNIFPDMPLNDKTKGASGHYFAAMASRLNQVGDIARLHTPVVYPYSAQCLHFWYQVNGNDDNTQLRVYVKDSSESLTAPVFETNADTAFMWEEASITINSEELYQVVFEHVVGERHGSFSAIDDITISNGACNAKGPR